MARVPATTRPYYYDPWGPGDLLGPWGGWGPYRTILTGD